MAGSANPSGVVAPPRPQRPIDPNTGYPVGAQIQLGSPTLVGGQQPSVGGNPITTQNPAALFTPQSYSVGGQQPSVMPPPPVPPSTAQPSVMPAAPAQPNIFQQSAGAYGNAINAANAAAAYQPQQVGTSFGYTPSNVAAQQVGTSFGYTPSNVAAQQVGTSFGYTPDAVSTNFGYTPDALTAERVGTTFGYDPQQVAAQAALGGIQQYFNPYEQQVIEGSMGDLERQRMRQMAQMGAQATAARAFGGSRQGVAQALTNEAFAQQGGQLASQLRAQGFQTALGASQQDVANQLQAALANQGATSRATEFGQSTTLQAQQANQNAALQAAQANQAARARATEFGQSTGLQAQQANQAARAAAAQFGQSTGLQAQGMNQQTELQAALANQAANAAATQFGQNLGLQAQQANQNAALQAAQANQGAYNAAQQFGQNLGLQAQQANQNAGLNAAQLGLSAAGQLGNLSQTGFNMGNTITQQQMQQGAIQQAMNQALIDAAKGQYNDFTGAPQNSLATVLAALGGANMGQQTTTQQNNPGLLQYLTLGLGALSDIRLKENIKPVGNAHGVQFYTWDWNEKGKRIADPKQPKFGVIADEMALSHPQHVSRGKDGYLRVNYTGLIEQLRAN